VFVRLRLATSPDVFIDLLDMTHLHLAISQAKGPKVEIRCNISRGGLRVSLLLVDS
jgi:hypothetical protein